MKLVNHGRAYFILLGMWGSEGPGVTWLSKLHTVTGGVGSGERRTGGLRALDRALGAARLSVLTLHFSNPCSPMRVKKNSKAKIVSPSAPRVLLPSSAQSTTYRARNCAADVMFSWPVDTRSGNKTSVCCHREEGLSYTITTDNNFNRSRKKHHCSIEQAKCPILTSLKREWSSPSPWQNCTMQDSILGRRRTK